MVDRFEYLDVELFRRGRVEWHVQRHEGISETLHANTNGTMSHVRSASFGRGIVVHINYTIEVVGNDFGYIMELVEVVLAIGDEGGESKRGEVANGSFIGGRVFNDFGAEVGRFDGAKVLLI
jgi:hypothetical protein